MRRSRKCVERKQCRAREEMVVGVVILRRSVERTQWRAREEAMVVVVGRAEIATSAEGQEHQAGSLGQVDMLSKATGRAAALVHHGGVSW